MESQVTPQESTSLDNVIWITVIKNGETKMKSFVKFEGMPGDSLSKMLKTFMDDAERIATSL